MTILSTTIEMMTKEDHCRICFISSPFLIVNHNYCHHQTSICVDCFSKWFFQNGHCDYCRKSLFPTFEKFYIINDKKTKIYHHKKNFLKALNNISKKDVDILKNSLNNFKNNFNLIEKYEIKTKDNSKTIFFFKIVDGNIFSTLKKYLIECNYKKIKPEVFMKLC